MKDDPSALLPILRGAWSLETSSQWLAGNPACGQCNVTALVVHDLFGGDILKTEAPGGWHFYNRVDGRRHDLTASQFDRPIPYADIVSDRDEALAGTEDERYRALKRRIAHLMGRSGG
jgi:hypothetical protein